jgi:hypothetical protein
MSTTSRRSGPAPRAAPHRTVLQPAMKLQILQEHQNGERAGNVPDPCVVRQGRGYLSQALLAARHRRQEVRREVSNVVAAQPAISPEQRGLAVRHLHGDGDVEERRRARVHINRHVRPWSGAVHPAQPQPAKTEGDTKKLHVDDAKAVDVYWPCHHAPTRLCNIGSSPQECSHDADERTLHPAWEAKGDCGVGWNCTQGSPDQRKMARSVHKDALPDRQSVRGPINERLAGRFGELAGGQRHA